MMPSARGMIPRNCPSTKSHVPDSSPHQDRALPRNTRQHTHPGTGPMPEAGGDSVPSSGEPLPLAGAVLAGGRSRRMGRDKGLITLGGVPMVRIVVERLARLADPVVVIADRTTRYSQLDLPVLADLRPGCGPLGGIHAALRQLDAREVFVLACDTPFVSEELIAYIASFPTEAPARVAGMDGHRHPLCGVYSRPCLPAIEEAIENRRLALHELLDRLQAATVPVTANLPFYDRRLLLNINDPAALATLDAG